MFVVLSLDFVVEVVVDQFSSREAECFGFAVFLLCAGVEE